MTFTFKYDGTEEQHSELSNIIISELALHFSEDEHFTKEEFLKLKDGFFETPNIKYWSHFGPDKLKVAMSNSLFFKDLEDAKLKLYDNIHDGSDYIDIHDWISDVKENLSFVPDIDVE